MKVICSLLLFVVLAISGFSQDKFYTATDSVSGYLLSINDSELCFSSSGNINDDPYYIKTADIQSIKLENAGKFILSASFIEGNKMASEYDYQLHESIDTALKYASNLQLYALGYRDSKRFYREYQGAATAAGLSNIWFGVGLIPSAIIASVPPKDENLNYPNDRFMENQYYGKGYRDGAYRVKKNKVWRSTGIAYMTWGSLIFLSIIGNL